MVDESNQNVFLIQKNSSRFEEFEISEFEISRVDCTIHGASCGLLKYVHIKAAILSNNIKYPRVVTGR